MKESIKIPKSYELVGRTFKVRPSPDLLTEACEVHDEEISTESSDNEKTRVIKRTVLYSDKNSSVEKELTINEYHHVEAVVYYCNDRELQHIKKTYCLVNGLQLAVEFQHNDVNFDSFVDYNFTKDGMYVLL